MSDRGVRDRGFTIDCEGRTVHGAAVGIARAGAFRQFELFGSTRKRMHVNPGLHHHVPRDETPFIELFLASRLVGGSPRGHLEGDVVLPVES